MMSLHDKPMVARPVGPATGVARVDITVRVAQVTA
jgi:hypothetical protein